MSDKARLTVSKSENLAARLHIDLQRQASAS